MQESRQSKIDRLKRDYPNHDPKLLVLLVDNEWEHLASHLNEEEVWDVDTLRECVANDQNLLGLKIGVKLKMRQLLIVDENKYLTIPAVTAQSSSDDSMGEETKTKSPTKSPSPKSKKRKNKEERKEEKKEEKKEEIKKTKRQYNNTPWIVSHPADRPVKIELKPYYTIPNGFKAIVKRKDTTVKLNFTILGDFHGREVVVKVKKILQKSFFELCLRKKKIVFLVPLNSGRQQRRRQYRRNISKNIGTLSKDSRLFDHECRHQIRR
jgi:hypothetical protein